MSEITKLNERTVQRAEGGLSREVVELTVAIMIAPYQPGLDAEGLRAALEPHHEQARARRLRDVARERAAALANGVQVVVVGGTLPHIFMRDKLPDEAAPVLPTRQHPDGPLSTYQ
jgi:hypothetical protein